MKQGRKGLKGLQERGMGSVSGRIANQCGMVKKGRFMGRKALKKREDASL
jgi:hypothetical protein